LMPPRREEARRYDEDVGCALLEYVTRDESDMSDAVEPPSL